MEISDNKSTGKQGEDLAVEFLKNNGFRILERNYVKVWSGAENLEVDIIAKKDSIIRFVEVKTVKSAYGGFFSPETKVDFRKANKIRKAADTWLAKNKIPYDTPYQIDVIAIVLKNKERQLQIDHFENI